MSCVDHSHVGFQRIEDGFDHEAFAQHQLINHRYEIVYHVAAATNVVDISEVQNSF